jgi:hypothetical protein
MHPTTDARFQRLLGVRVMCTHTMNFLGAGTGASGSTCLSDTVDRKSTMIDVEFALCREACNSCTLGRSSDIKSMTESNGSLDHREWRVPLDKWNRDIPLLPRCHLRIKCEEFRYEDGKYD